DLDAQVIPAAGGEPRALLRGMTTFGMVSPDLKAAVYIGGENVDTLLYNAAPFAKGRALDHAPAPVNPQKPPSPEKFGEGVILFPTLSPDGKTVAMPMDN